MRWDSQRLDGNRDGGGQDGGDPDDGALPGMPSIRGLLRTVHPAEFSGTTFHDVWARGALNAVPEQSAVPFRWTINPYRGCSHA